MSSFHSKKISSALLGFEPTTPCLWGEHSTTVLDRNATQHSTNGHKQMSKLHYPSEHLRYVFQFARAAPVLRFRPHLGERAKKHTCTLARVCERMQCTSETISKLVALPRYRVVGGGESRVQFLWRRQQPL